MDTDAKRVDGFSSIDQNMTQRDGLRRQRVRNGRNQALKIGTAISVLALMIAWLGKDDHLPEQTISIALPLKELPTDGFSASETNTSEATSTNKIVTATNKPIAPTVPSPVTIPVANANASVNSEQAVPAMQPSNVSVPVSVTNTASKDIQRINEQAIKLVNEGNPKQAIGLLETTLMEQKESSYLFENLRRLYAGFATQSYQLALEPGKAKPVMLELINNAGEPVIVQLASLDMKARSATQALPTATSLPDLPSKSVLSSETSGFGESKSDIAQASKRATDQTSDEIVVAKSNDVSNPSQEVKTASTVGADVTSVDQDVAPVAVAEVKTSLPSAPKELTSAEKVEATRAVMITVKKWADAWSHKDPDTYIALYAPDFKTKGMNHSQWEAYRRDRLTKPKSIRVELSDQKAIMLSPTHMRVTFNQMYASDSLKANDKKTLELELIDNQWRITVESGR